MGKPAFGAVASCMLASLIVPPAAAHFNMLLPEKPSAKRGEAVTIVYQWGHPFEHQLFDAPLPDKLLVRTPDDKTIDLTKVLEKTTLPAGDKKVGAFRLAFTPEQRGDFVFVLNTPPIWMEEDQEFLQDIVKVVLHVQAQKNWDAASSNGLDMVPLTRPYGLQAGMVFQARASHDGKPLANALVEIERYNAGPPKELPPDEHITRTAKTDPNGVATCTLPEAGWWCVTAQRIGGERERNGKRFPVKQRVTFWVFVDEKVTSK